MVRITIALVSIVCMFQLAPLQRRAAGQCSEFTNDIGGNVTAARATLGPVCSPRLVRWFQPTHPPTQSLPVTTSATPATPATSSKPSSPCLLTANDGLNQIATSLLKNAPANATAQILATLQAP
ncbi:hypothetical protein B0H16DRAFT_1711392 [Mycena metata]|uniref:Secreted protein n=1 Tax=Mycena metata TaxID=1033252 RepID=A0AAD7K5W0_9AGAR|nr:hypothetical protein B0H16DRAFT_1711392 [Mycena metata]